MTPEAILLSLRDRTGEGSYRFSCPSCLDTVEKPADRKVAALLLSAGVELDEHEGGHDDDSEAVCVAPGHPESPPSGPAFTVDDLINFHFLLRDDAKLNRSLSGS
jgi:hypothetical protein